MKKHEKAGDSRETTREDQGSRGMSSQQKVDQELKKTTDQKSDLKPKPSSHFSKKMTGFSPLHFAEMQVLT